MGKITLYGLSRSGKTCYLNAMSQTLGRGIDMGNRNYFTAICPNPFQQAKLDEGFDDMANGKWPSGTEDTTTYNFDLSYCLRLIQDIEIKDYRGGLLNNTNPTSADAQRAIFEGAKGSEVLLFFIGADIIMKAMESDSVAMRQINFCNTLYAAYQKQEPNYQKTAIMLVITKADILDSNNINRSQAKNFVITRLQPFFGRGTNLTVGITMVSLGRDLQNTGDNVLSGDLIVGGTAGNLHIPLLYSAYNFLAQEIERIAGELLSDQARINRQQYALQRELSRSPFARFFVNNESAIRNTLGEYQARASRTEQQKQDMITVFSKIGSMLKAGADIFVDGELI